MKNKNSLDQHFRQKLGSHEETPPPEVWTQVNNRHKRSPIGWVAAVAALLLLSGGLYTGYQNHWLYPAAVAVEKPLELPAKGWQNVQSNAQLPLINPLPTVALPALSANTSTSEKKEKPLQANSSLGAKEKLAIPASALSMEMEDVELEIENHGLIPKLPAPKPFDEVVLLKLPLHGTATADSVTSNTEKEWTRKEVYAYANEQFQYLLNGQKPQLPHFKKEPILTIHLQPLFKNN